MKTTISIPEAVFTEAMNSVYDRLSEQDTEFATAAARKILVRESRHVF